MVAVLSGARIVLTHPAKNVGSFSGKKRLFDIGRVQASHVRTPQHCALLLEQAKHHGFGGSGGTACIHRRYLSALLVFSSACINATLLPFTPRARTAIAAKRPFRLLHQTPHSEQPPPILFDCFDPTFPHWVTTLSCAAVTIRYTGFGAKISKDTRPTGFKEILFSARQDVQDSG